MAPKTITAPKFTEGQAVWLVFSPPSEPQARVQAVIVEPIDDAKCAPLTDYWLVQVEPNEDSLSSARFGFSGSAIEPREA